MGIVKNFWGYFFSFEGRVGRLRFFLTPIFMLIPLFMLMTVFALLEIISQNTNLEVVVVSMKLAMYLICSILMQIIMYSLLVRRVHDFGLPAFKSQLFVSCVILDVISFIVSVLLVLISGHFLMTVMGLLALARFILYLIALVTKGDEGANQFGERTTLFG